MPKTVRKRKKTNFSQEKCKKNPRVLRDNDRYKIDGVCELKLDEIVYRLEEMFGQTEPGKAHGSNFFLIGNKKPKLTLLANCIESIKGSFYVDYVNYPGVSKEIMIIIQEIRIKYITQ